MWQEQRQCSNSWTWARCSLVAIISPVMQGLFKTVNGMLSLHSGSFWSLLPQLRNKGMEENTNVEPDTCSPFVAWAAWCSSLRALAACILRKKCICKYPQIILQTSAEVAFCFQTPPLCLDVLLFVIVPFSTPSLCLFSRCVTVLISEPHKCGTFVCEGLCMVLQRTCQWGWLRHWLHFTLLVRGPAGIRTGAYEDLPSWGAAGRCKS